MHTKVIAAQETPTHAVEGGHRLLLYPDQRIGKQDDSAEEDSEDKDHFSLMYLEVFTTQR